MQNFDIRVKFYRIIFFITILAWFFFAYASAGKIEIGYNKLYSSYLPYNIFQWLVFIIMFGSGMIISILARLIKDFGIIIFEILLLTVTLIYASIYFDGLK
jgi:hypothetical protein